MSAHLDSARSIIDCACLQVRENYLQVIDNILSTNQETIVESQTQVNSSARLLESLRTFSENVPITANSSNYTNDSNFVVYAFENFGLILEDVEEENFDGQAFNVDLGPVKEAIRNNGAISEDSLVRMASALPNATAAVVVSDSLFDIDTNYQNSDLNNNSSIVNGNVNSQKSSNLRLIFTVFLLSSVFQNNKTDCSELAIGSIIASLQTNSSTINNAVNTSNKIHLQEYREVSYRMCIYMLCIMCCCPCMAVHVCRHVKT